MTLVERPQSLPSSSGLKWRSKALAPADADAEVGRGNSFVFKRDPSSGYAGSPQDGAMMRDGAGIHPTLLPIKVLTGAFGAFEAFEAFEALLADRLTRRASRAGRVITALCPRVPVTGADCNTAPVDLDEITLEYERLVVKSIANAMISEHPSRRVPRRRFCANLC